MIHFLCPFCKKAMKAGDENAGKKCKCTSCNMQVDIPGGTAKTVIESAPTNEAVNTQTSLVHEAISQQKRGKTLFYFVAFAAVFVAIGMVIWFIKNKDDAGSLANKISHVVGFVPGLVKSEKPFAMESIKAYDYSSVGKTYYLCEDGSTSFVRGSTVMASKSQEAYKKWLTSYRADDKYGFKELISNGSVFVVEPQTECKILAIHYFAWGIGTDFEVRITEGPNEGKAVFVHKDFLCKPQGTNR